MNRIISEELKSCPFCGSNNLKDDGWVECRDCGTNGPDGSTPQENRKAWNLRNAPQADRPVVSLGDFVVTRRELEDLWMSARRFERNTDRKGLDEIVGSYRDIKLVSRDDILTCLSNLADGEPDGFLPEDGRKIVDAIHALQLPQPVAGQVGEAITSIEQVDLSDMAREVTEKEFDFFASKEALRQPVETVGEEDQGEPIHQVGWLDPKDPTRIHVTTHYMIRELGNPENWLPIYAPNNTEALRTQPQATVVEVPTVEEIENAYDGGWDSVPTLDDLGIKESDDDFCSYFNDHQKLAHGSGVRAIHALIQRTIGGGK